MEQQIQWEELNIMQQGVMRSFANRDMSPDWEAYYDVDWFNRLIEMGLLKRVGRDFYRITPAGRALLPASQPPTANEGTGGLELNPNPFIEAIRRRSEAKHLDYPHSRAVSDVELLLAVYDVQVSELADLQARVDMLAGERDAANTAIEGVFAYMGTTSIWQVSHLQDRIHIRKLLRKPTQQAATAPPGDAGVSGEG